MKWLLFFVLLATVSGAQKHTLSGLSDKAVTIIEDTSFQYAPGDTFGIPAGTYGGLRFIGFKGSSEKPLVFINEGGVVHIQEAIYDGIAFRNCQYIHLTGAGSSTDSLGIKVERADRAGIGVAITELSSDFEIDHIEIFNTDFAGIMAKTDPSCDRPETWRRNGYVLKNLHIHHNYIHETAGEAMYIGYTGGYKVKSKIVCDGEPVFGHWLENVDIHDNLIENAGWDGIQVNLARKNCRIYNNKIYKYGIQKEGNQNFGMSIGGGRYEVFNNYIENSPDYAIPKSAGIQFINVERELLVYNNVIALTGGYGIFIHNRVLLEEGEKGLFFLYNTIANCGVSNIFYNGTVTMAEDSADIGNKQDDIPVHFYNNLLLTPAVDYPSQNFWKKEAECFLDFIVPSTRDSALPYIKGNIFSRTPDTLGIIDYSTFNFRLIDTTSILYNSGVDLSSYTIDKDIDGVDRPSGGAYDVGAYEYRVPVSLTDKKAYSLQKKIIFFLLPSKELKVVGAEVGKRYSVYSMQGKELISGVMDTKNNEAIIPLHRVQNQCVIIAIQKKNGTYFYQPIVIRE